MNLSEPIVMGILNITPDSFYDGGQYLQEQHALQRVEHMVSEGAAIIDVGAASTRPGASVESSETEIQRLMPLLKAIIKEFPQVVLSIDTYNARTARMALDEGAHIINDISAGSLDQDMFSTIAEYQVPYIIMHTVGTPDVMQKNPSYQDVTKEVAFYFSKKLFQLNQLGVHDIIIDPGFGFAKSMEHNYQLLQNLDFFRIFDLPILAGVSRKGMIHKALKVKPEESLNGTTVVNTMALLKGASILRVHDVKAAVEAVKICKLYQSQADF
ncbi:MAG: dihydropteroate synthase [Bacteroidales bacterium]